MKARVRSKREATLLAGTLSLALIAATAAPGHAQTTTPAASQTVAPVKAQAGAPVATQTTPAATKTTTAKTQGKQPTTAAATTPPTKATAPVAGATAPATTAARPAAATTAAATPKATTAKKSAAPADSAATAAATKKKTEADGDDRLRGGQEGTVFKSLTIEGEDRVHVDFERPELKLDLELEKAPGLDWGSAADVLNRSNSDLDAPLVGLSAKQTNPYLGRPWLSEFATGPVARFHPSAEGVASWKLIVVDSKGATVRTFWAKGDPPKEIDWDGRATDGKPVTPGLTYSYVFEAHDKAG